MTDPDGRVCAWPGPNLYTSANHYLLGPALILLAECSFLSQLKEHMQGHLGCVRILVLELELAWAEQSSIAFDSDSSSNSA